MLWHCIDALTPITLYCQIKHSFASHPSRIFIFYFCTCKLVVVGYSYLLALPKIVTPMVNRDQCRLCLSIKQSSQGSTALASSKAFRP